MKLWKKSEIVNDRYAMAHLAYLAEYQKERLLELVRTKRLPEEMQKAAMRGWDTLNEQEDNPNLGFGGAEELAMEAATSNGEAPEEPSHWTRAEKKQLKTDLEKMFPGEKF